jgi:hypothetical protein
MAAGTAPYRGRVRRAIGRVQSVDQRIDMLFGWEIQLSELIDVTIDQPTPSRLCTKSRYLLA